MSDTETNKKVVTEFIDGLFSRGDFDVVEQCAAEDYVDHDPPFGSDGTRAGMRATGEMIRAALPDWRSDLHLLVAEDDVVAEHFTAHGMHRGELMGVAATGKELFLRGINLFRLRDGRIVERWGRLDELGFLRQLGVIPEGP